MASQEAVVFIVRNAQGEIAGLAVVSSDLRHDPLISREFFEKNYPNNRVYHFPSIALADEFRAHPNAYRDLMRAMMAELPDDAIAVFFHSEGVRPALPRLVRLACTPEVAVHRLDTMACALCTWQNGERADG